jgi:hypothetical protein
MDALGPSKIRQAFAALVAAIVILGVLAATMTSSAMASPDAKAIQHDCAKKLRGTKGGDKIFGTNTGDRLRGGGGSDAILGRRGHDCIYGGIGPDVVHARDGVADIVSCGPGVDRARVDADDYVSHDCEAVHAPPSQSDGSQSGGGGADEGGGGDTVAPTSSLTTPSVPQPTGPCDLELSSLIAPGCKVLNTDTSSESDPEPIWGNIECAQDSREQLIQSGGDTHPTSTGEPQGNDAFRQLTVFDGDDFYGERCELGRNENRYGIGNEKGTFALYHEGDHLITFVSTRIPSSFPSQTTKWQTIMQMKQSEPSGNDTGGPMLEMQLRGGRFYLENHTDTLWSAPAPTDQWVRFAFDAHYSQQADASSIQVYVDLNGDGDANDEGEQSKVITVPLLQEEIDAGWPGDGIAPGQSIPSHLRVGVYHDPAIPCPSGCGIDFDNVQVVDPS